MAWHLPAGLTVLALEDRWRCFALPDAQALIAGRPGLFVRSLRRADAPASPDFARPERIGELARARHGMVAERFALYRVVGQPGSEPVVVLPRKR